MSTGLARVILIAVVAVAWLAWPNVSTHPSQKIEWVVVTTPNHKGHSPNVPDAVVCAEQKWEDGVNVGREKVVHVADINQYKPGDPCPEGDQ
jgi:hypothetical protein